MSCEENIQTGVPRKNKNGACYCWSACFTMWLPCGEKSVEGTPKDCNQRQLSQPLNHPSLWTLLGSPDSEILKVAEQVYRGAFSNTQCTPCRKQGKCMRELHQELCRHMARAGLQSETGAAKPSTRSCRCSHSCTTSWTQSPQPDLGGAELTKWLREDTSVGWSWSRRRQTHSRGRNSLRQCQFPSLHAQAGASHPLLALHDAVLQMSGSATPWNISTCNRGPTSLGAGHGKMIPRLKRDHQRNVRFDINEELGDDPMFPLGLTLFLAEGMATEWDDAPSSSTAMDSPRPTPSKSPQSHPAHMGGAWPYVPAKPPAGWPQLRSQSGPKEGPDPVNHPHRWIHVEMGSSLHPHWWKEIKASGRVSMGSHIVKEGYSDYKAQHYVQWQVATFRLPAIQEASGWWDVLPWLCRLFPQDFMPITDTSSPKDFWIVMQEKALALAQRLQTCAKESGAQTGILCDAAHDLQRCMTPWWPSVGKT